MKVSVLLPSYGRPQQLVRCVKNIKETSSPHEIIVILDNDAESAAQVDGLGVTVLNRPERGTCISAWNDGAKIATGDAFVVASDDFYFQKDWLDAAEIELVNWKDLQGLVALNDLHRGQELATIFLLTRKYAVESLGGVIYCPHYKSFFCDNEITARAKAGGRWAWAKMSVAEHRHWSNGKAAKDATYSSRDRWWGHDEYMYNQRAAKNFPNDYIPSFGL